jgi:glutamate-1-semialdehyde 2,1-aminomutase
MDMNRQRKYTKSTAAFKDVVGSIPGGVNSPVRAFRGVDVGPLFIDHAKGSKIYDIDGNEYIDYVCSWGPMILGHAHPQVLEAINSTAARGTSFGAPTQAETAVAKKIINAFDSIRKVRLVSSGTEAVMTAIRLARGYTGRDIIVKMAGCYHGHSDSLLVDAGSGVAENKIKNSVASSSGVPQNIAELTAVVPYNDIDAVKSVFEKYRKQIAAVLIEPVAANMGVVPPVAGYLAGIRSLCDSDGAILIFDEVITGFRLSRGGAQELFGIKSDITCLGKIIGGGLPMAAIGGRSDIMDMLAPVGPVYQAGTLSGNPLATAAAIATLDILEKENPWPDLESSSAMLQTGIEKAASKAGVAITVNRVGSIMSCFFTNKPVVNFEDVRSTDIKNWKKFFAEMLQQGIYLAPSAYEAMFISTAHSREDIEKSIEAAEISFKKL